MPPLTTPLVEIVGLVRVIDHTFFYVCSPSLSGMTMPSSMMSGMPRIEPETIRQWREDNEKRLAEKDAKEEEQLEQLREQAKKELSDW